MSQAHNWLKWPTAFLVGGRGDVFKIIHVAQVVIDICMFRATVSSTTRGHHEKVDSHSWSVSECIKQCGPTS